MKPFIGILGSTRTSSSVHARGSKIIHLNHSYINAVEKAGGIPFVIPITEDYENLREQIGKMDGIILSGGVDINPLLYNEQPKTKLGEVDDELDKFSLQATLIALELNKSILGICRGIQLLNVSLGGTLNQDVSYVNTSYIKHMQEAPTHTKTHSIDVDEDCVLYPVLGSTCNVNSFHHQCIRNLGKNLKPIAYSKDNIIEAVQKIDSDFVVGVQWHPELIVNHCEKMLGIFKLLVNSCK